MVAIEILREDRRWAVLVSAVDDLQNPTYLECLIAFTNAPDPGNLWHDRGFPLVDAAITLDKGALVVASPCFFETSACLARALSCSAAAGTSVVSAECQALTARS